MQNSMQRPRLPSMRPAPTMASKSQKQGTVTDEFVMLRQALSDMQQEQKHAIKQESAIKKAYQDLVNSISILDSMQISVENHMVQLVTHLDHVQTDFIKIEGKVKRVKEKQDMANQSTVRSFAQQQEISSLLNGEVNDMQRNNQQQLQRVLANVTVLRNVKAEFQAKANALHEELSQIDRTVAELLVKVEADKQALCAEQIEQRQLQQELAEVIAENNRWNATSQQRQGELSATLAMKTNLLADVGQDKKTLEELNVSVKALHTEIEQMDAWSVTKKQCLQTITDLTAQVDHEAMLVSDGQLQFDALDTKLFELKGQTAAIRVRCADYLKEKKSKSKELKQAEARLQALEKEANVKQQETADLHVAQVEQATLALIDLQAQWQAMHTQHATLDVSLEELEQSLKNDTERATAAGEQLAIAFASSHVDALKALQESIARGLDEVANIEAQEEELQGNPKRLQQLAKFIEQYEKQTADLLQEVQEKKQVLDASTNGDATLAILQREHDAELEQMRRDFNERKGNLLLQIQAKEENDKALAKKQQEQEQFHAIMANKAKAHQTNMDVFAKKRDTMARQMEESEAEVRRLTTLLESAQLSRATKRQQQQAAGLASLGPPTPRSSNVSFRKRMGARPLSQTPSPPNQQVASASASMYSFFPRREIPSISSGDENDEQEKQEQEEKHASANNANRSLHLSPVAVSHTKPTKRVQQKQQQRQSYADCMDLDSDEDDDMFQNDSILDNVSVASSPKRKPKDRQQARQQQKQQLTAVASLSKLKNEGFPALSQQYTTSSKVKKHGAIKKKKSVKTSAAQADLMDVEEDDLSHAPIFKKTKSVSTKSNGCSYKKTTSTTTVTTVQRQGPLDPYAFDDDGEGTDDVFAKKKPTQKQRQDSVHKASNKLGAKSLSTKSKKSAAVSSSSTLAAPTVSSSMKKRTLSKASDVYSKKELQGETAMGGHQFGGKQLSSAILVSTPPRQRTSYSSLGQLSPRLPSQVAALADRPFSVAGAVATTLYGAASNADRKGQQPVSSLLSGTVLKKSLSRVQSRSSISSKKKEHDDLENSQKAANHVNVFSNSTYKPLITAFSRSLSTVSKRSNKKSANKMALPQREQSKKPVVSAYRGGFSTYEF